MIQFETYRPLLFSIAYRMLGSAMEAEDIVHDAFIKYQRVADTIIESPRAYLTTIVTRLCLNQLNSAQSKRETRLGPTLPEPIITAESATTDPAQQYLCDESISMAFLVLLEQLNPAERAVFLLREVFDYAYPEIARIVGKSEAACRQIFSRANKRVVENRPRFDSDPAQHQRLLREFVAAVESGSLETLVSLLAEDVTFWADGGGQIRGAATRPINGAGDVAAFVLASVRLSPRGVAREFTNVNGKLACIMRRPAGDAFLVILLETGAQAIHEIRVIADPDKLSRL